MGLRRDIFVAVVIHCLDWEILASMFITGHRTVIHKLVSNILDKVSITELRPKVSANMYLTWHRILLFRNVTHSTNPYIVIVRVHTIIPYISGVKIIILKGKKIFSAIKLHHTLQ
ncbi:hypothetical protein PFLUV_G00116530 [Perca fluviatilis]|uniref:Uncharacterized protein n=1 Tax=Perca fluviatilis TaxID=8168 RepID=A0A6A5F5H7_PERFL|nr:hypothetical protein PFLUV_G00116530 [Perca fluviatilis]